VTTHNTHKKKISLPPVVLVPAIPVSELLHTYALDSAELSSEYSSREYE